MASRLDDAFRALADSERRRLLRALAEKTTSSDRSLAYPDEIPSESGERTDDLQVRMYHNHLPMLEGAGIIEWHEDDQEITPGPKFEAIRPLLRVMETVIVGTV